MPVRVRVVVAGKVQGVFFRESMRREAEALGVRGWVRNNPDGRVEALVEGDRVPVDALVTWCHRGPPDAMVASVHVTEVAAADLDIAASGPLPAAGPPGLRGHPGAGFRVLH